MVRNIIEEALLQTTAISADAGSQLGKFSLRAIETFRRRPGGDKTLWESITPKPTGVMGQGSRDAKKNTPQPR